MYFYITLKTDKVITLTAHQTEVNAIIDRLKENISRLEYTIKIGWFQKGYVANCQSSIASYKQQILNLQNAA
jgi:hypothetical protein